MKFILTVVISAFSVNAIAIAETTTFKQQILPIDCVYEVIDVGTQKLRYITPDTCPIDPGPPIITEPPVPPALPVVPSQIPQGRSTVRWTNAYPVAVVPPEQRPQTQPPEEEQVQGIVATIKDVIIQNRDVSILLLCVVGAWWLGLFIIKKSNRHN